MNYPPLYLAVYEETSLDILNGSLELTQNTVESWLSVWEEAIFNYTTSPLWIALVTLGLLLATLSVLYLAIVDGARIIEKRDWAELVKMLIWPLVVLIFLGNNGALLANSIRLIRDIGLHQTEQVISVQSLGITYSEAMRAFGISSAAQAEIQSILHECTSLPPAEVQTCLDTNQPRVEEIVEQARADLGTDSSLAAFLEDYIADRRFNPLASVGIWIVRLILTAVQWAFVNVLEAAILLTASFAPIAMGLSLLPVQGKPIVAWGVAMLSLFGLQLGYNIVVGMVATVLVDSGSALATDIGFLFLLALFGPKLAYDISKGGGVALYQGLSRGTQQLSVAVSDALGAALGNLAGAAVGGPAVATKLSSHLSRPLRS